MDCPRWNDEWVAHLYGELDPKDERTVTEHLAECASCRERLERLDATRLALHSIAEPDRAPSRILVLAPTRRFRPVLAFAAGIAAASALFLAGRWAGGLEGNTVPDRAEVVEPAPSETTDVALLEALDEQSRRLAELERMVREPRPVVANPAVLTRDDFRRSIDQLETRWQQQRTRELEFLVRSISAAQARVDQTQEALQVLAVRDDPRYLER